MARSGTEDLEEDFRFEGQAWSLPKCKGRFIVKKKKKTLVRKVEIGNKPRENDID